MRPDNRNRFTALSLKDITLIHLVSPLSVGWRDGVEVAAAVDVGALPAFAAELMTMELGKGTKTDNHSRTQCAH